SNPHEVELALLRHRRAKALAKSELALSDLAGVGILGCRPGRLPHLLPDILEEFLDPGGGRHRSCALDANYGALGLAVREVELDQARGHQHAADQDEEDDDVLAKEPPSRTRPLHRRNASARSRIFRGTAMPRRTAVFKFTARSSFSAPSTGRSCVRAPRRVFATSAAAPTPCA